MQQRADDLASTLTRVGRTAPRAAELAGVEEGFGFERHHGEAKFHALSLKSIMTRKSNFCPGPRETIRARKRTYTASNARCLLCAYWSDLDDVLFASGGDPKH